MDEYGTVSLPASRTAVSSASRTIHTRANRREVRDAKPRTLGAMQILSSDDVDALISPAAAVEAIRGALLAGFDPATDPHRVKVALGHGEMHLLASSSSAYAGVKILGIQPPGSTGDVPLVQGSYLLMGGRTLTPELLLEAASLTRLRTPAVSIAGVYDLLRATDAPLDVAIFGSGVQARGHAETLLAVCDGIRPVDFTFISRHRPGDLDWSWVEAGSDGAAAVLRRAGLVITATSSPEPIVRAADLRGDAIVLAVGAHTADTRELHEDVLRGAQVIVEDVDAAFREAGDVVQAVDAGAVAHGDLIPMAQVVRGEATLDPGRRVVFKTVGMGWQDLAVAEVAAAATA